MIKTDDLQSLEYTFHARQFAYDILRRFFLEEPSKEYLEYFVKENLIELFPFAEESEQMKAGITEIKKYLTEHDVIDNKEHYEDLHWDYTRLFIGPFELPAPPWESVYVRKDRLLFQANTVAVRSLYNNFGYEINHNHLEAEDHIGLELDFMFHLNNLCIEQVQENNFKSDSNLNYLVGEQSRFLRNHLLVFTSDFSRKVIDHAETEFYSGMAKLLTSYLEVDAQILKETLELNSNKKIREGRSNA